MVQSRKMTSGTVKGKKISVIFVRFEACSDVTLGRMDLTLLDCDSNVYFACWLSRSFCNSLNDCLTFPLF